MSSYGAYLTAVAIATGCMPLTMADMPSSEVRENKPPLPDWKRMGHNRKLKGWQKGKRKC